MMEDDFDAAIRGHRYTMFAFVVVSLLTYLIFWLPSLDIGASSQTTRALLNSLAIAQSSALAIVASVTLLNVQLVADRYSTEVVKSALRSSPFKPVLSVFIASIAFDLILVYNIIHHSAAWFTLAVVVAASWAAFNAIVLYRFVFNSVGVLTPSSLITAITNYDPSEFAERTNPIENSPDEGKQSTNTSQEEPLYHLYVIISSSVGRIDIHIVQKGLRELHSVLKETIEDLEESDGEQLCQNAFRYYYPRVVEQCLENGKIKQAERALRDLEDLLEMLETEVDGWNAAHFAGIQGLFTIRDKTSDEAFLEYETIPTRLEQCTVSYWNPTRLQYILNRVKVEVDQTGNQQLYQNLILQTHTDIIERGQKVRSDSKSDLVDLWETKMEDILSTAVRNHQNSDSTTSRHFLEIWPQMYQRNMTHLSSHREWLITVIFELAVFHGAHHEGEYDTARDALVNTLRGAQPEHTQERIETLRGLDKRPPRKRSELSIIDDVADEEEQAETAFRHNKLAKNLVSEAVEVYRKQVWNTDKAIEYIRTQPGIVDDCIDGHRFIDSAADAEYSLISDPATSDGQVIKLVVADEINSDLVNSLPRDGVARFVCVGPLVTGSFGAPDLDTVERSLPELRPPEQASIYDYYDWT
ncbi:DUF2254 family protein [Halobacterium bonnevillei]|uniref:DUF2254 domain-containing protein n=1 Tax=Halobacterium bonnevillei TaxID=2692200 RepID=A0A6B0SNN0_9EURY|nr:DUF2254 family protein [Halobacterium bonnevillei]MXR19239.1 DUF2254 domain-containing protein [Halobacterium bonnevillei]